MASMPIYDKNFDCYKGWAGGAKVLGKFPVPGRPTNLDYSRARAYGVCSRCGWFFFSSPEPKSPGELIV